MTAQVPDTIELDGVEYVLAGHSGTGLFDPLDHGVLPQMIHTGCWRGFICRYALRADALHLATLRLGPGSTINGEPLEAGRTTLLGATLEVDQGEWRFRYDALPVPYTGTLLAADGFVQSMYVHMGFHPAWKYERVVELTLDGGRVTARRDLSAEMAEIRRTVRSGERTDGRPLDAPTPPPGR